MDPIPGELQVTDRAPQLVFVSPVHWRATLLLRDSAGRSYAVATAIDPLKNHELFVAGSTDWVPLRRLFLSNQNGWELVQDEGLQFTALRLAEQQ
jgi:hypothetical protein